MNDDPGDDADEDEADDADDADENDHDDADDADENDHDDADEDRSGSNQRSELRSEGTFGDNKMSLGSSGLTRMAARSGQSGQDIDAACTMGSNGAREIAAELRDDRATVEAVLAGDRDAFRRLVDREGPAVVRACYRILGDIHEAEDAAQEAFVTAYRSLPGWRGDGPFGAWLTRIAVRIALRQASRRKSVAWLDMSGDRARAAPRSTRRRSRQRRAPIRCCSRCAPSAQRRSGEPWRVSRSPIGRLSRCGSSGS